MARTAKNTTKKDIVETKVAEVETEMGKAVNKEDNSALLDMLAKLQAQVNTLTEELNKKEQDVVNKSNDINESSDTKEILDYLTNKKSDKEITIIHNQELMSGLTTHIVLTGLTIDFRTMGEQRVLSWQQFEECVSKYRNFFERHVILLAPEHRDIAERYNVPYLDVSGQTITRDDLKVLGKMPIDELEKYYKSLLPEDQDFICSYWLGKCYEKADGYYDRYKVEMLNRLNGNRVFDNILMVMNGDFQRD